MSVAMAAAGRSTCESCPFSASLILLQMDHTWTRMRVASASMVANTLGMILGRFHLGLVRLVAHRDRGRPLHVGQVQEGLRRLVDVEALEAVRQVAVVAFVAPIAVAIAIAIAVPSRQRKRPEHVTDLFEHADEVLVRALGLPVRLDTVLGRLVAIFRARADDAVDDGAERCRHRRRLARYELGERDEAADADDVLWALGAP